MSRPTLCARSCWVSPASGWAPRWRPRRSTSCRACRAPAAARSCAACSRRASWACPRAICRRSRATRDDRQGASRPCASPSPAPADEAHPRVRGALRGDVPAREDQGLPASLRRRGGGLGRRDAGARARGRGGRDLPRARPGPGPRRADDHGHGRDVRQARGLLPRPRRLDAPVRPGDAGSTAATRSSAAAPARRRPRLADDQMQGGRRSPPASSATARSTRASSTSR